MIHDDEELAIYKRQLGLVEEIVASWRQKLMPHNPRNFALYAEGAIEQADILRAEINEYLVRKNAKPPETSATPAPAGNPTAQAS